MPSVPKADRKPNSLIRAYPTLLFIFERGLCSSQQPASDTLFRSTSPRCVQWASRVPGLKQPGFSHPIDKGHMVPAPRSFVIQRVLGGVNMRSAIKFRRHISDQFERFVIERERGMRPYKTSKARLLRFESAAILHQPEPALMHASASRSSTARACAKL